MNLTGADIANSGGVSKFTQDITCPWCLTASRLELGLQHVHGDLAVHCQKCGKFSRHKTADKWFDQHQDRLDELKDTWKKIPIDAYITCRQSTRGTPWVYTVYLGGAERPEEFHSRDIVEHLLINEYGMSWKQAHGALMSAALTPGQRIYLQRHTRLVMAAEDRDEMKRTGRGKETLIPVGATVRVAGTEGIFLRYSSNDGFAIVAFPAENGFGDAEVPVMDLEVVDAGGPEVAEDFEFEKAEDEAEEAGEVGGLEEALEHIEVAEEIVEDLVLEEGGAIPEEEEAEHEEVHEEEEHEEKEEGEEKGGNPFAAKRGFGSDYAQKLQSLQQIIQDPNTDPQTLAEAQKQYTKLKSMRPAQRKAFFSYKSEDDLAVSDRPKHKTVGPKLTDTKLSKDDTWVPRNEDKNPLPKEDANLAKKASREAQRRVHTHYSHAGDLKRAIDVNRDELSIEDIRDLCRHYANTGRIGFDEADEIAFWFIGDKPRLLCASDLKLAWEPPTCEECGAQINRRGECGCEGGGRNRDDREDFHSDGSRKTAESSCPACGGPGVHLGVMGKKMWFRCRNCGIEFSKDSREASAAYEEWLRKKQPKPPAGAPGSSSCTCRGAYDPHCPDHGAQESRRAVAREVEKDKRYKCPKCGETFSTVRKNVECPRCHDKGAERTSTRKLAEVPPDSHPESGVSSGSGELTTPDPKWQSGDSANSVSGPDKVKDHGTSKKPKPAGEVKTPDAGLPKGAFRRKADGVCQKCGTALNQQGQCPTCNSSAEQNQAQSPGLAPAQALSISDLRKQGGRHPESCNCGFCSRMRENQNSKKPKEGSKDLLSSKDLVIKTAGVGIFVPALHNGQEVLVIAIDNTSLRATVQDGGGNQRQVNVADLEPVKTGPYSGMPK